MLGGVQVELPSTDIAVVGWELTPLVLLQRTYYSFLSDEVNGRFLSCKWFRIQNHKKVEVYNCNVHPTEKAKVYCVRCVESKKPKPPIAMGYHCSPQCYFDAWPHHRYLHERLSNAAVLPTPAAAISQTHGDETWVVLGYSKTYTPTAYDVYHVLRFECVLVDARTRLNAGPTYYLLTSRVMPAPSPIPRRMIPVGGNGMEMDNSGTFSVLSYNILSDAEVTDELCSYCPSWALSWPYRSQNLLREIVGYGADIVCLQEVQNSHFEEFFLPELYKHGYQAIFQVFDGNIHGCATFFCRDRFSHVKIYLEFTEYAQSTADAFAPSARKDAIKRLVKDNVALFSILQDNFSKQLICVANTHVKVQQELKDVKIWQVHILLKGLKKIAKEFAASRVDISMVVCGDFHSVPGSAPHALVVKGQVDPFDPDAAWDPLNILHPPAILEHELPLVSAYSSFARVEEQRQKMDSASNEPRFTKLRRDYMDTHDYIFYSADTLMVESLLELLDEDRLRKLTALPSPDLSSDHIALLAEFRCKPRQTRC